MSRSGDDDTPRGGRSARGGSAPGPASRAPNGGPGSYGGGGGLIRPPLARGGADDPQPSGPNSAASRTPRRNSPRSDSDARQDQPPDDYDGSSRRPAAPRARRPSDPRDSGPQSGRYGRHDRDSISEEELGPRRSGAGGAGSHAHRTILSPGARSCLCWRRARSILSGPYMRTLKRQPPSLTRGCDRKRWADRGIVLLTLHGDSSPMGSQANRLMRCLFHPGGSAPEGGAPTSWT